MRLKTLLCLAALTAGTAITMAQSNVYSLNIVGYVNTTNANGFSMIANPLNATNNDIKVLFADAPVNAKVFRFQGGAYVLYFNDVDDGWSGPGGPGATFNLNPGEGVFFQNPSTPYVKTYVGEVVLNSTNVVPNGFSLRSSVIPQQGKVQTDLLYPGNVNDKVFRWSGTAYILYFNDVDDGWTGPGGPGDEPVLRVAESAFFQNNSPTKNWVRNFVVGP
jgi:hypothetical protein